MVQTYKTKIKATVGDRFNEVSRKSNSEWEKTFSQKNLMSQKHQVDSLNHKLEKMLRDDQKVQKEISLLEIENKRLRAEIERASNQESIDMVTTTAEYKHIRSEMIQGDF